MENFRLTGSSPKYRDTMLTMVRLDVPERYGISVLNSLHYFTTATTAKVELSLSPGLMLLGLKDPNWRPKKVRSFLLGV